MHDLFSLVLNVKDLSKAGDLFNLPDRYIMNDISEILGKVREITASVGYAQNDNDQSVVEIVVSKITATLRNFDCIESHIVALVDLLKTCLSHDLKPLENDMDPPHAKIASDVLASIFLNYTKRNVMKPSIPIAVKFLHKGNREITRNVSSYLPLAAIAHSALVAEHIQPIIDSVIGGNYTLAKIIAQIYPLNPERINEHLMAIANILSLCDDSEKSCLLNLLKLVASSNSAVTVPLLEPSLPQLLDCLNKSETIDAALGVLIEMASESKLLQDHLEIISNRASKSSVPPSALILAAKLLGEIGLHSSHEKSTHCLTKMILMIPNQDPSTQIQILREIVEYSQRRPNVMNASVINKIQRYLTTSRGFSGMRQVLIEKLWDVCSHRNVTVVNIRDNDQLSTTTGVSSSTELLKPPTPSTGSPYSYLFPSVNSGHGNFVHRIPVGSNGKNRPTNSSIGALNMTPRLQVVPIKPNNISGLRHPYVSKPSSTLFQQHQSGSGSSTGTTSHYKSLTRLPPITGEYKKRTALVSPYQNRSICSSIGLQDDYSASGGLKSVRNSQNSMIVGNSNLSHQYPVIDSNMNNSIYSANPQQNLSLFKNYFSANSGTLSSSASIHAMANNNFGSQSRSATHLSSNHQVTPPSVMGPNKGLPSPSPRTTQDSTLPVQQSYQSYASQPDLRHQSENNHRISVFEPFPPIRDTILHFCEKHLDKIKSYMDKICVRMPLPVKCTIEERKSKKSAKLHFSCQCRTANCLYGVSNRLFTMKTRHPRIWIHLMFLALQARSSSAMSSRDSSVTSLKNCWDTLKPESKSFLAIVTNSFPSQGDQDTLSNELRNAGFFDLFEFNALKANWGCFFCNYPARAMEFLSSEEPILEGCLKEKKGKWRLFKRWRTRYFTLSGGQLQAKGTDSSSTLNLHQILSLRVTRGQRSIPKAFEIFTEEKKIVLKPKDGKNASEWVQCLSVLVAQKAAEQRDENVDCSIYSGHHPLGGKVNSMYALRTEV